LKIIAVSINAYGVKSEAAEAEYAIKYNE
jgi:hypothetical protein